MRLRLARFDRVLRGAGPTMARILMRSSWWTTQSWLWPNGGNIGFVGLPCDGRLAYRFLAMFYVSGERSTQNEVH